MYVLHSRTYSPLLSMNYLVWSVRHENDESRIFFFWGLILKVCNTVRQRRLHDGPVTGFGRRQNHTAPANFPTRRLPAGFHHQCYPALRKSHLPLRQTQRHRTRPSFSTHSESRGQDRDTESALSSGRP